MANSYLKTDLSKPKLLKDFLNDDSRNDFGSYPPKPCTQMAQNQQFFVLKRSKSRTSSSTTLAIHKASEMFIKTLQYFPFASLKFSSRIRRKGREVSPAKVKVKDILRWRSSRDLVEDESTPLDVFNSPSRCTINTTTSGSSSCSSPLSINSSNWCESEFSADDFPSWCYASEQNGIKMKAMDEAEEQYTPVSVLASPFEEDGETEGNEAGEKAMKLLHHVKETTLLNSCEDNLLMDFFWEELISSDQNEELLIASSQDWLRGVHGGCFEWRAEHKRNNYVKEMEKGLRWNNHEEEKDEMSLQLEKLVFNSLVDDVLFDLFSLD